MILGSALLNSLGAFRNGLRYTPRVGFRDPAFLEWLHLSLPLMIGVSLVMFDQYFLSYFGSNSTGGITFLGNAKDLFNAPFNIIGPAAGAASLPFFASLYQQRRQRDFSISVGRSVSRLFAVGMLVSAWMMALAPWLMDLLRRGHFHRTDAATITGLFRVLAITLAIWAVQGIYARAFYAASDTKTPAIAGTLSPCFQCPSTRDCSTRRVCAAWPSRPTSASWRRPHRWRFCCIANSWPRCEILSTASWGAHCWRR